MQQTQSLDSLVSMLRSFKGITRKSVLGSLMKALEEKTYDDAGALKINEGYFVVSTDGIVEELVQEEPWLAGFYSVLVNVNDVVAKGAKPLGYAHTLSSNSARTRLEIVEGIKHGIEKYGLKFLKGHTHPDTSYNSIDGVVVGIAKNFLSSTTAKIYDTIVAAVDLNGKFGVKGWIKIFDSSISKSFKEIEEQEQAIIRIAEDEMANASRDISGPGIVGTVTMLCESSRVGAQINLEAIPKPRGIQLENWLTAYPSTGFIFATNKPKECIKLLEKHSFAANAIGEITGDAVIRLSYKDQVATFMDFSRESIFGLKNEEPQ